MLGQRTIPDDGDGNFAILGRYEYVSLPEMGLNAIPATLESGFYNSFLSVAGIKVYERMGVARLSFCFAGDPDGPRQTIEPSGARPMRWPGGRRETIFKTNLWLALPGWGQHMELWLTEQRLRSTDLVLGRNALPDNTHIDAGSAFLLGDAVMKLN